jgi:hypothetical protein
MEATLGTCPPTVLRGVIDDEHLNDMRERNRARAAELIKRLGEKYACHPANGPRFNPARQSA